MAGNERPLNIRLSVKDQEVVARALRDLGKDGAAALKKLEDASAKSADRMKAHRAATNELQDAFSNLASSAGPLGGVLSALGPAGLAAAAGIGAATLGIKASLSAAAEAETAQIRLGAVLKATGNSAGLTQTQLTEFASEVQKAFAVSDEAVIGAEQTLIRLGVTGENIKKSVLAAIDLAAAGQGDLASNAEALGRAFARPELAGRKLLGLNLDLTASQRDLLKSFGDTGDEAAAADLILKRISETVGGTGAAEADSLTGRVRGVGQAWDEMLERMGNTAAIQGAAGWLIKLADAAADFSAPKALSLKDQISAKEAEIRQAIDRPGSDPRFPISGDERKIIDARIAGLREELRLLNQKQAIEEVLQQETQLKAAAKLRENKLEADNLKIKEDQEKLAKDGAQRAKVAADENAQRLKREADLKKEATQNINDNIEALSRETENMKLSDRERAIAVAIQQNEAIARRANIQLTDDQVAAIRREVSSQFDLKESIEASQQAERDRIRAVEDSIEETKRAEEKRAEAVQKIYDNAAENMQDALAGGIRDSFDSKGEGFVKNFFNRVVDLAKDAAAQIAAAGIAESVFGSIGWPGIDGNTASGGGALGALGAAGNVASLGNFLRGGSSLFGLGGSQGGVARLLSGGGLSSVGPVAPGLGSTIGAALPYVGAATAVIGLARGLGIFGPGKSVGPNAGGQLLIGSGGFSLGPTGADNGGNVSGVSAAISQAAELLNALRAVPGLGTQGSGIASYIDTFGAGGITDAAGLVRDVINKGLITGLKDSERDILNGATDLGAAIEQVLTAREFPQRIADMLLEATDPQGAAIKRLDTEFDAYRQAANDNGQTLADIEKLYAIRRQEILKQFGDASVSALTDAANSLAERAAARASFAVDAAENAYDKASEEVDRARAALTESYNREAGALRETIGRFSDFSKSVRDFRDGLFTGNLSPLSGADQRAVLEAKFNDLSRRAKLGENIDSGELQDAASAFLEAARKNSTSALEYTREVARVGAALDDAADTAERQADIADSQLAALNESVSGLITVNESVLSVRDAIDALTAALLEQKNAANRPGGRNAANEITGLYQQFFGRTPDSSGLSYWLAQSAGGQSMADIAANIIRNPEFTDINPGIEGLYRGIFNRSPDAEGLAYWQAQQAAGASLDSIRENFIRSAEYADKYGIPKFADGGWADGWSVVGERGPELVNMRGQVYSNSDSRSLLDLTPVVSKLTALEARFADLEAGITAVAIKTDNSDARFRKWDTQGMPPVRAA